MKNSLPLTAAMGLVALGSVAPNIAAAQQTILKIAHILPAGDPRDLGARKIEELVEADASCSMDVQVYPSGQLGMFNDLNEGVQFGSIEMSVMPASYIVGTEPLFGVFDFPFFWPTDAETLLAVYHGPAMAKLGEAMADHNMVLLDVWHTGFKQWTSNKPLNTLGAYDGLISRVMPSPILVEEQKALGLTPVTMPFPETYSALQSGAIEVQENPNSTSWNMKFHEVQSHVTMTSHGILDQVILINKPFWQGLSQECQTAINTAMVSASKVSLDETTKQEAQAMAEFKEAGLTVVEVTPEERVALRDAILPTVEQFYIKSNGEKGQAILDAFKAELGG